MKINRWIVYANLSALSLNGSIVWMVITKTFPASIGVLLVISFFAGAVWLSCYMNGALPYQRRQVFHSAPTEKVEAV